MRIKHPKDGNVIDNKILSKKLIRSLVDHGSLKKYREQSMIEKSKHRKEISETIIRVQEEERIRIGHELHDNVNQILSVSRLFVDMLVPVGEDQKNIKSKSIEYILLAIEEIRKLSKELAAPQLKDERLKDSIQSLIDDLHLTDIVKIELIYDHESELLSQGRKVTIFRIVQEQLKNIIKYSFAKKVEIMLQSKDGNTELIIKDDGIGFDPKQTHRGIGLFNMQERTKFYDGSVEIQTAPGKGCTLIVTIPNSN